jgi:hypothetical protein
LLQLAPQLQEQILFLPRTQRGRDAIHLGQVQPIAAVLDWTRQQKMAAKLWRGNDPTEAASAPVSPPSW